MISDKMMSMATTIVQASTDIMISDKMMSMATTIVQATTIEFQFQFQF